HGVDVVDEERDVVDAEVEEVRRLTGRVAVELLIEHDVTGAGSLVPAEVDSAPPERPIRAVSSFLAVDRDSEADDVPVEGDRSLHVGDADGDVGDACTRHDAPIARTGPGPGRLTEPASGTRYCAPSGALEGDTMPKVAEIAKLTAQAGKR